VWALSHGGDWGPSSPFSASLAPFLAFHHLCRRLRIRASGLRCKPGLIEVTNGLIEIPNGLIEAPNGR